MQILPLAHRVNSIVEERAFGIKPKHLLITLQTDGGEDAMEITHSGAMHLASAINRHLMQRQPPLRDAVTLQAGHTELAHWAHEFKVQCFDGMQPNLRLHASLGVHPNLAPGAEMHQAATTLAIHMDQKAAIGLYAQIRDLAQTMGWPLPREGEGQA